MVAEAVDPGSGSGVTGKAALYAEDESSAKGEQQNPPSHPTPTPNTDTDT
jgi:hypothetical protein